jgi:Ulp1 family protease
MLTPFALLYLLTFHRDWVDKAYNAKIPDGTVASRDRAKQAAVEIGTGRTSNTSLQNSHSAAKGSNISQKRETQNPQDLREPSDRPARQAAIRGSTTISSVERRGNVLRELGLAGVTQQQVTAAEQLDDDPETLRSNSRQKRLTRSSNSNGFDNAALDKAKRASLKTKFSDTGGLGPKWEKPLVFPKTGKKREIVNYDDLLRLDDDEFLNDSLVGLFLLYVEHYLEHSKTENWKKTYFFNSYFYHRLTQTQKGRRAINYEGVEKWTRTIDLFNRDFVIVPVNENLHWYVAIICNLTYFREEENRKTEVAQQNVEDETSKDPSLTVVEDVEVSVEEVADAGDFKPHVVSDQPEADEVTRSSFQNMHLDDVEQEKGSSLAPSSSADKPESQSKKGRGRQKSARKSLQKYNPQLPVIITLDSLASSRSATCTALRQYIKLEALNKRGWEIDETIIKGMTAKDIPRQSNYSDCGLYLCAYMEKFVLNPYGFVHQILQREDQQWPEMESGDLRTRFRDLVMELQRRQESKKPQKPIPEVGKILLSEMPVPQKVERDANETEQNCQGESSLKNAPQIVESSTNELQRPSSPDDLLDPEEQELATLSQLQNQLNRPSPPIVVSDDDEDPPEVLSSRPAKRKDYSKKYQRRQSMSERIIDDPRELARTMRERRSPVKYRKKQDDRRSVEEEFNGALQRANIEKTALTPRKRDGSIDMKHMKGIEGYAKDGWGDRLELTEVPETQQEGDDVNASPNQKGERGNWSEEEMLMT